jgi:hypothetical protein
MTAPLVGQRRLLPFYFGTPVGLLPDAMPTLEVEILEARELFGRLDVRVRPVAGTGEAWVMYKRTRPVPPEDATLAGEATGGAERL